MTLRKIFKAHPSKVDKKIHYTSEVPNNLSNIGKFETTGHTKNIKSGIFGYKTNFVNNHHFPIWPLTFVLIVVIFIFIDDFIMTF